MTVARYYRLNLVAPLILPAIAYVVMEAADQRGVGLHATPPEWLAMPAAVLVISVFIYGIPYAIVAAGLWFLGRNWTDKEWRRCAVVLPAAFSLVAAVVVAAFNLGHAHDREWLTYARDTALLALGVGYGQVALIAIGEVVGRGLGCLGMDGPTAPQ